MSTISTPNRTVTVDALVARLESAGVDVADIQAAAAEILTDKEREDAERDAILAKYDAENAQAQATACGFEGCTGDGHDAAAESSEWQHDREHEFGNVEVSISMSKAKAWMYVTNRDDPLMTAGELRSMADEYESFPAWLRARAAELDALNA